MSLGELDLGSGSSMRVGELDLGSGSSMRVGELDLDVGFSIGRGEMESLYDDRFVGEFVKYVLHYHNAANFLR